MLSAVVCINLDKYVSNFQFVSDFKVLKSESKSLKLLDVISAKDKDFAYFTIYLNENFVDHQECSVISF